ncbi:MAG: UDP-N-acetylmuramoyl-L-alanyl-D-glutamate--2,6-diaminopimelate ligase [Hyphomicrobiaceae bacterium]|jgi:UDP-N-acetylmuramoyl-L-alanyl-D-glutamate--2,6-diaminopimelate ligase
MIHRLADLAGPETVLPPGAGGIAVAGISADSRRIAPGWLFSALGGAKTDGARFAADAIAKGAVAILADTSCALPDLPVPVLRSDDPRRALALMAARFTPGQPATILAVTGTSGKTSVAEFTRQILAALGRESASLGTLGIARTSGVAYGALTTPDPVSLHASLDALAADGVTHLAMEASSHGLDQRRLDGVRLTAGAFTNLGRDHLDYHPTMEAYFDAKARLFDTLLVAGQGAVIDVDSSWGLRMADVALGRGLAVTTTGRKGRHLRLVDQRRDGFAQHLVIEAAGARHDIRLPLIGDYQATNALLAAGLAMAAGEPAAATIAALGRLQGVRGRLEIVGAARGGLAVVDYAHKPDALAAALATLRPFVTGRLVCVFGCGGDRDRGKRPIMGRIAVEAADVVIVTDDNPRSEDPAAIRREILDAAPAAREIGDRHEAIDAAIRDIGPGDVVVIAGKGHEDGQIIGSRTLPFSDQAVVRTALDGITA